MRQESAAALKEWAVVEEAMAAGAVSLLLRKGGIHERRGDFTAEHRAFWIFPTGWHENRPDLAPHLHPFLDAVAPPRARGTASSAVMSWRWLACGLVKQGPLHCWPPS